MICYLDQVIGEEVYQIDAHQAAACRLESAILGATGSKMVAEIKKGSQPKTATP
jgi:hypothetical protein